MTRDLRMKVAAQPLSLCRNSDCVRSHMLGIGLPSNKGDFKFHHVCLFIDLFRETLVSTTFRA